MPTGQVDLFAFEPQIAWPIVSSRCLLLSLVLVLSFFVHVLYILKCTNLKNNENDWVQYGNRHFCLSPLIVFLISKDSILNISKPNFSEIIIPIFALFKPAITSTRGLESLNLYSLVIKYFRLFLF